MTIPTIENLWDTNNTNSVDPGPAKRADGYSDHSALPASEHNYLHKAAGDWVEWLAIATRVWARSWDGLDATTAGEEFLHRSDEEPWVPVVQQSKAVVGFVGADILPVATDGDYFAWSTRDDPDVVLVHRLSDPLHEDSWSIVNPLTSLQMDGSVIWTTEGTMVAAWDYAGNALGWSAETGVLIDCSQGYALVRDGQFVRLYDATASLVSTFDCGAGNTALCGRITKHLSPGGDPNHLILWTTAMGAHMAELARGDTGASVWSQAITPASAPSHCWLTDRGTCRLAAFDMMMPSGTVFYEFAFTAAACNPTLSTTFRIPAMGAFSDICATPRHVICWTIGGFMNDTVYVGEWHGAAPVGVLNIGVNSLSGLACIGNEVLWRGLGGLGEAVSLMSHGRHTARMRRYDIADWRPYCTSLVVEDL
jgi:hypothetical protein